MHPRPHLAAVAARALPAGGAHTPHARPVPVAGHGVDAAEAAARAASMARHPAGTRARVVGEQRTAAMAHHPAGRARQLLG